MLTSLRSLCQRSFVLLCGVLIAWQSHAEGKIVKTLGKPIRISPTPGPSSPDPILQNLQEVMDNHYQKPYFPGGRHDYLSQIWLQTNTYFSGTPLVINPIDDRIMGIQIGQNSIYEVPLDIANIELFPNGATFQRQIIGTNIIAQSFDGGLTWSYAPPIQQIIPLGGTISQVINDNQGPGFFIEYNKFGRLLASGQGFFDMVGNIPGFFPANPLTGWLFTASDNNGKTWPTPQILLTSERDYVFNFESTGFGPFGFNTTVYPPKPDLIHASTSKTSAFLYPLRGLYGEVQYCRSKNGGKCFSKPNTVYRLINDPKWKAKYFDSAFKNPNNEKFGGLVVSSAHPQVVDKNVLLLPVMRAYPQIDSTVYTASNLDSSFDQAVVRSLDGGKTWLKTAGATPQYFFAGNVSDPGYILPYAPSFFYPAGVYNQGTNQSATYITSPFTGRVYVIYAAGNPNANADTLTAETYNTVLLNASSDQGATWSKTVQINRTPTNLSFGQQIAFGQNAIMTLDGHLAVVYYDFRNWTGFPGEDVQTQPLQTDAWLAIYEEVDNPERGSTGVGLNFVEEKRITPQSFDARIMSQSFTAEFNRHITSGIGTSAVNLTGTPQSMQLAMNHHNVLFVVFSMTGSRSSTNTTIGYKGMTIDTNNLSNIFIQRYQFPRPSNQ